MSDADAREATKPTFLLMLKISSSGRKSGAPEPPCVNTCL
jgi:hypothetical protein